MGVSKRKQKSSSDSQSKLDDEFELTFAEPKTIKDTLNAKLGIPGYLSIGVITYTLILSMSLFHRLGSQYIEPVYGNVLPDRHKFPIVVGFFAVGCLFGTMYFNYYFLNVHNDIVQYKKRLETEGAIAANEKRQISIDLSKEESQYAHRFDNNLGFFLAYAFDICAVFAATISIRMETVYNIADNLVAESTFMKAITGYAYVFIVGMLSFGLSSVIPRSVVCDQIGVFSFLFGISALVLKFASLFQKNIDRKDLIIEMEKLREENKSIKEKETVILTNEQEAIKKGKIKTERKKRNLKTFISFLPIAIVVVLVFFPSQVPRHCALEIQPQHNINPNITIISRQESYSGFVEVVDLKQKHDLRVLRAGHSILGAVWNSTSESAYGVFYYFDAPLYAKASSKTKIKSALHIGLGAGIAASSHHNHGINVDVVEYDPAIYVAALKYFNLPKKLHGVYLSDGLRFVLGSKPETYDYIVHDIFSGGSVPSHMFTNTFLKEAKRIMKPEGIFSMNYVGFAHKNRDMQLIKNTLEVVFKHVRIFLEPGEPTKEAQNIVFFASDYPIEFEFPESITNPSELDTSIRTIVLKDMEKNEIKLPLEDSSTKEIITLGNGLLEDSKYEIAASHWRTMREIFPKEFWLNY
ncbi:hypothetical protein BB559_002745 [Furculomyces boomerangus]|uniref:PABS domain-containing protein n=2 Tax=Harpellales TaxID=61421 RepID=A0A2T9YST9_9FUNG|nr:hypothetical protein BB559_002745 [Furculomyces boomerangus]PVZ97327.1 hypothetical protein BB558_006692 [Smittium angustum]PVZ99179.1 hypothetical protein BB558_004813 [Smittium angustum]